MAKSKKQKVHNSIFPYVLIFFILLIGVWLIMANSSKTSTSMTMASPSPSGISATFECSDNKSIQATFTDNQVSLQLSDGRSMTLPQAMSASGARYANEDESVVFWNKGNTAFITEGNEETYSDCVTSTN